MGDTYKCSRCKREVDDVDLKHWQCIDCSSVRMFGAYLPDNDERKVRYYAERKGDEE